MSEHQNHEILPNRVSILSPVFNEELHIEEMIQSVRSQEHEDWELLFADDGSTDSTVEIVRRWTHVDSRIRLLSESQKLGKVRAFNLAYSLSTGASIVLLAGDDRLPPDSLTTRCAAITGHAEVPALGLFKLRSFSTEKRYDGMVIPRGKGTSASGGVMIMNRLLADLLFPIPEELPSEDIWLGQAGPQLATYVAREPKVVLEYRIHPGNSNPRQLEYHDMQARIDPRYKAWDLLASSALPFTESQRLFFQQAAEANQFRKSGHVYKILLMQDLPLSMRLSLASMASPRLYALRSRYYALLSGWIGQ